MNCRTYYLQLLFFFLVFFSLALVPIVSLSKHKLALCFIQYNQLRTLFLADLLKTPDFSRYLVTYVEFFSYIQLT